MNVSEQILGCSFQHLTTHENIISPQGYYNLSPKYMELQWKPSFWHIWTSLFEDLVWKMSRLRQQRSKLNGHHSWLVLVAFATMENLCCQEAAEAGQELAFFLAEDGIWAFLLQETCWHEAADDKDGSGSDIWWCWSLLPKSLLAENNSLEFSCIDLFQGIDSAILLSQIWKEMLDVQQSSAPETTEAFVGGSF